MITLQGLLEPSPTDKEPDQTCSRSPPFTPRLPSRASALFLRLYPDNINLHSINPLAASLEAPLNLKWADPDRNEDGSYVDYPCNQLAKSRSVSLLVENSVVYVEKVRMGMVRRVEVSWERSDQVSL